MWWCLLAPLKLILYPLGFTSGGVALGSIAAAIQSFIGDVAAGSLFSFCQYVGATVLVFL